MHNQQFNTANGDSSVQKPTQRCALSVYAHCWETQQTR